MLTDKAMKASELRIGNCIEYNGMIKTIFSINKKEFITFDTDEVIVGKYRYEQSPSLHISNFKPIPLSEEWLLKFGFEREQRSAFLSGAEEIYHIFYKGEFLYNSFQNRWYWKRQPFSVSHVHQLQNLYFALTGEELTIK